MGTVSTQNEQKIKTLLDQHKPGTVCLASWLEAIGISRDLQKRYRRSGWLESLGPGAFKRPGDAVDWRGGLYALQSQAGLRVHAGARTALALQGLAHYARLGAETLFLFSPPKTPLPAWFKGHDWTAPIRHVQTSILPDGTGLTQHEAANFAIRISAPERAMLEWLHLAPKEADLVECYQVMEGLVNLRPALAQELLHACSSVKVKRLFLFMAEKAQHQWFQRLDVAALDLGAGDRNLAKGGVYVPRYGLVIPKALAEL